jgi:hypothetical protein
MHGLAKPLIRQFSKQLPKFFSINEFSGAFGDIGTDIPLLLLLITFGKLDPVSTFIVFGLVKILSGLFYGIPVAVQPMKAFATIFITQCLDVNLLYAAGYILAFILLICSLTNTLELLSKVIPEYAIHGIQFGLGISLIKVGINNIFLSDNYLESLFLIVLLIIAFALKSNLKNFSIIIILILAIFASVWKYYNEASANLNVPSVKYSSSLTVNDFIYGFLFLALPQLPLTLSNSIFLAKHFINNTFPNNKVSASKLGLTLSLFNMFSISFSGIPCCHGAGGIAGHYIFGGRTGGCLVIYGIILITCSYLLKTQFILFLGFFPISLLGFLLSIEGLYLMYNIRKITSSQYHILYAIFIGLTCMIPIYGYLVATLICFLPILKFKLSLYLNNNKISNYSS